MKLGKYLQTEIMSRSILERHSKPGSIERSFPPSMWLLITAHPWSRTFDLSAETLKLYITDPVSDDGNVQL